MSKVVAVYKTGTGRDKKGTGHRDVRKTYVCVGDFKSETVCDLRTRDDREGLGDIKYGTRERLGWRRRTSNTGTHGTRM